MLKDIMHRNSRIAVQEALASPPDRSPLSLREIVLAELNLPSLPRRRVSAGTLIMRPESATKSLYFVLDGKIRLYRLAPTGEEVFQGELGPGDSLKCPRILGQHDCHSFAEAIVDSNLEVLSKSLFERLQSNSMAFNQMLVREIIHRAADVDQRFYETSVMPMKVRLHAELLRISRRRRDGALIISPPPTHQDLASRIGSQREAVSKELGRLEKDGVITRGRAAILLVQEDQLRREITEWNNEPAPAFALVRPGNEAKFDIPALF
jgi:CRP/FNR family cyclic AMP-dependent transcriptional regulator